MADIKQAAKWMEEGATVRCSSWAKGAVVRCIKLVYAKHSHDFRFELNGRNWPARRWMVADFLAEDWEIATQ